MLDVVVAHVIDNLMEIGRTFDGMLLACSYMHYDFYKKKKKKSFTSFGQPTAI